MDSGIRPATESDLDEVRALFREYEAELDEDLCFQSFEQELASLPGEYAPPAGRLLVAEGGDRELAGTVAFRRFGSGDEVSEMKRMFVRSMYRGTGLGRRLAEAIVAEARAAGYRRMVLDTLAKLGPAISLYRSLGFRDAPAYYDNPIQGVVYLQIDL